MEDDGPGSLSKLDPHHNACDADDDSPPPPPPLSETPPEAPPSINGPVSITGRDLDESNDGRRVYGIDDD